MKEIVRSIQYFFIRLLFYSTEELTYLPLQGEVGKTYYLTCSNRYFIYYGNYKWMIQ